MSEKQVIHYCQALFTALQTLHQQQVTSWQHGVREFDALSNSVPNVASLNLLY